MVTAIQTRSVTDLDALKTALGVTVGTFDDELTDALLCAKVEADLYANNPFLARDTDDPAEYADPEVELAIPAPVEKGLVQYAAAVFADGQAVKAAIAAVTLGGAPAVPFGAIVTNVGTGSLSVGFAYPTTAGGGSGGVSDPLNAIKQRWWSRYRLMPGSRGASVVPGRRVGLSDSFEGT